MKESSRTSNAIGQSGGGNIQNSLHTLQVELEKSHAEIDGLKGQLSSMRRQLEASVEKSHNQLSLIFENARDFAIFSTDLERRVTRWNPGAEHLLGFTKQEMIGKSADIIFTPEDREAGIPAKEQQMALTKGRAVNERWHLHKDGRRLWGSGFMMAMQDAEGHYVGLLKIFRDHTEVRSNTEELRLSRENLFQALEEKEEAGRRADDAAAAKDDFLAALSHELRTPLNPALMTISALEGDLELTESVRTRLATARRCIELEARLIDDLLDVTRITRRMITLDPTLCDLHELLEKALEIVLSDPARPKVMMDVQYEASEHWVLGEPSRLQQIFWNLLKNAFKFSHPGGRIMIRTSNPASDRIEVMVKDAGEGITPDVQERIFEPFVQGNQTARHRFGGLGLGLAISKSLAVLHGGDLEVYSAGENQGATFTLKLNTSPPADLPGPPPDLRPVKQKPLRLLVVEDHAPTLNTLSLLLERDGHRVFQASTAGAGLAIADKEKCDVLISDIGLPDLSGLELMREIRRLHGWPGIAVSGYGMPKDLEESREAGFFLHLTKPIKIAALRQALHDLQIAPTASSAQDG